MGNMSGWVKGVIQERVTIFNLILAPANTQYSVASDESRNPTSNLEPQSQKYKRVRAEDGTGKEW